MNSGKWFWDSFKYLGDPLNKVEEKMEREMKLEDVDDILYEMKRDEELLNEHDDN